MEENGHADFSNIVGVFRDRDKAEQALEALKQAHLSDEQPELTVYEPQDGVEVDNSLPTSDTTTPPNATRYLVHVRAEGKEQDAVGILVHYGANNSDIPAGTELVHGSIVSTGEAVALHTTPEGVPDSLLGKVDDTKNIPRG